LDLLRQEGRLLVLLLHQLLQYHRHNRDHVLDCKMGFANPRYTLMDIFDMVSLILLENLAL
jgi:hypothetical protein